MLYFKCLFYVCIFWHVNLFSFIALPHRLNIPAVYEKQQAPPEWSPKFLPADFLFFVTFPRIYCKCQLGIRKEWESFKDEW